MVWLLGSCVRSDAVLLLAGYSEYDIIDLLRATRLKGIVFWCGTLSAQWITVTENEKKDICS